MKQYLQILLQKKIINNNQYNESLNKNIFKVDTIVEIIKMKKFDVIIEYSN